jgi:pSer/pThr/pTyr-binding forkhead associated (FHA) protein
MDAATIRWESLGTIVGVLVLAIWALGDTDSGKQPVLASGESMLRFRVHLRNQPGRTVDVLDGARLGRSSHCEVVLDDTTVSKQHAQIRLDVDARIEDMGSTNGTFVNGRRVQEPTELKRGDRIALGTAKIVFLGLTPRGRKRPKG